MIDLGKVGEYQFAAELLKRGYVPLWPSTETVQYDLSTFNKKNKAIRIQVKATELFKESLQLNFRKRGKRGKSTKYSPSDFDLLVLWIKALNDWYLIPMKFLKSTIRIKPKDPHARWAKFKNAWHLLEE